MIILHFNSKYKIHFSFFLTGDFEFIAVSGYSMTTFSSYKDYWYTPNIGGSRGIAYVLVHIHLTDPSCLCKPQNESRKVPYPVWLQTPISEVFSRCISPSSGITFAFPL